LRHYIVFFYQPPIANHALGEALFISSGHPASLCVCFFGAKQPVWVASRAQSG